MPIVYSLRTQHDNLGDLLINDLLILELANHDIVYLDYTDVPIEFINNMESSKIVKNLKTEYNKSVHKISFYLWVVFTKKINKIILGPGHIECYTFTQCRKHLLLLLLSIYLKIFNISMFRIGFSIGRISEIGKIILYVSSLVMNFYPRDDKSMKFLSGKEKKIQDLIFLIDKNKYRPTLNDKNHNCNSIIISFRLDRETEEASRQFSKKILSIMNRININNIYKIIATYQVDRDVKFIKMIKNFEVDPSKYTIFHDKIEKQNAFILYGYSKVVISNRLHVVTSAFIFGGIGIAYVSEKNDQKIINVMKSIGLDKYVIYDNFNEFDIEMKIIAIINNRKIELDEINKITSKLRLDCKEEIRNLFE
jgi:hypothetical protein